MVDVSLVKKYLRIDDYEDDEIIETLIESAIEDLKDAGVPEPQNESKRYSILVSLHVSMYYENRDPAAKIDRFNAPYQSLLLKLKEY